MRTFLALAFATFFLALAPRADARTVRWDKIEVRSGDDAKRVEKKLGKLLKHATKKAKWGKGDTVKLRAKLVKLTWERNDDVLRIHVTVVARIVGGQGARSQIRIGGRPNDKSKIEEQALKIVADGLITRLSDMARTASKKAADEKKKKAAEDEAAAGESEPEERAAGDQGDED